MIPPSADGAGENSSSSGLCRIEETLDGARMLEESDLRRTALSRLLHRLHTRFGAERAVAVFTNDSGALRLRAARNFEAAGTGETPPVVSRTIVEDVAEKRAPVLVRDALNSPVLSEQTSIMEQGLRSVMCVPLLAADELLGVIYMDNLSESGKFSSEDLETLNLVASYAAASLHGARIVEESASASDSASQQDFDELNAGMAHSFKNVLTAIQTRLRLSQQTYEQLEDELEKAYEAVEVGREHIRQIAHHSEVCSNDGRDSVNLADVLRESLDMMRDRMQAEETSYELEIDIPDSAHVRGHRAQLREAFINLLSNAMDAIGDQGKLTLSLTRQDQEWVARVGDTGHGIGEKHRDQIFDAFFTTKGENGTGLGLHMVRSVVESHGGSVSVDSDHGEGTVVTVRLPARND